MGEHRIFPFDSTDSGLSMFEEAILDVHNLTPYRLKERMWLWRAPILASGEQMR